jgi:hypothetical protein
MRGAFFKAGRELGAEFVAQPRAVRGEKVQCFVPVAQPPFAVGGFERKPVVFHEFEHRGITRMFA